MILIYLLLISLAQTSALLIAYYVGMKPTELLKTMKYGHVLISTYLVSLNVQNLIWLFWLALAPTSYSRDIAQVLSGQHSVLMRFTDALTKLLTLWVYIVVGLFLLIILLRLYAKHA